MIVAPPLLTGANHVNTTDVLDTVTDMLSAAPLTTRGADGGGPRLPNCA